MSGVQAVLHVGLVEGESWIFAREVGGAEDGTVTLLAQFESTDAFDVFLQLAGPEWAANQLDIEELE